MIDYRIVERAAFSAGGKFIVTNQENNQAPSFWAACEKDGTIEKLLANSNTNPLLGICYDVKSDGTYKYMVGIETQSDLTEGMVMISIPASTWAVFESIGPIPQALFNVWERIFTEFFPESGYIHGDGPDLEVYYTGDHHSSNYRCEIWIPVKKISAD